MENLGLYSPGDTDAVVNGRTIQGLAEAEMMRTERDTEEEFRMKVGAKGDFLFEENLDKAGRFVITLLQNSPDNVFFQTLLDGKVVFSISFVSRHNFREQASATAAMVGVRPRKTMAQETTNQEWVFVCGVLNELDKAL